jgi:5-methylcytosine-specific restriction enzyme A
MSPLAPPRVCATCGRPGCTQHRRQPWHHAHPVPRIRGRKLQQLKHQLSREQPMCVRCGVQDGRIRDHIIPLCEGGLDVAANTQALCPSCHDAKTKAESRRHHV